MNRLSLTLWASLAAAMPATAADVTTNFNAGSGGFYSPADRSGPYSVDSSGNAWLFGQTIEQGSASPNVGITPVIATGTALQAKASPGNLYGAYALNTSTTAGFLVGVNASAIPSPGAPIVAQECALLPASGTATVSYGAGPPDGYSAGIVLLVSTSCTTFTPSTLSAFIKGRAR